MSRSTIDCLLPIGALSAAIFALQLPEGSLKVSLRTASIVTGSVSILQIRKMFDRASNTLELANDEITADTNRLQKQLDCLTEELKQGQAALEELQKFKQIQLDEDFRVQKEAHEARLKTLETSFDADLLEPRQARLKLVEGELTDAVDALDKAIEDRRELERQIKNIQEQAEQKRQELEEELEQRRQEFYEQLEGEREEHEQELQEQVETANQNLANQLEAERQELEAAANQQVTEFTQHYEGQLARLQGEIEILASEKSQLLETIAKYDKPLLPPNRNEANTWAHAIIEYYCSLKKPIKLDYYGALMHESRAVVSVTAHRNPQDEVETVSLGSLKAHSESLRRVLVLAEPPAIEISKGCYQFVLTPHTEVNATLNLGAATTPEVVDRGSATSTAIVPEVLPAEDIPLVSKAVATMNRPPKAANLLDLVNFPVPADRFDPKAPLCDDEKLWVRYLWYCKNVRTQREIIFTVWKNSKGNGISSGGSGSYYQSAKRKLDLIKKEFGLEE